MRGTQHIQMNLIAKLLPLNNIAIDLEASSKKLSLIHISEPTRPY